MANAFVKHTNSRVVALADLFRDKVEAAKSKFAGIDEKMIFVGPNAFREIANAKDVDMILLTTPDYFHVEHLDAVVTAGKHCYCEKPAAVDVVGARRCVEIGKRAVGRLSLEVGLILRAASSFAGTVKRVQEGAIGPVGSVSGFYHAPRIPYPDRGKVSPLEWRIRNFYWDRVLSGDVIVDQNIHIIDICNWAMGALPVKAVGSGGRRVRHDPSDVWDHFSVTYTYPNGTHLAFNSVQFGESFWDVGIRFLGAEGVAECYYSGTARVTGPKPWEWKAKQAEQQGFSTEGGFSGLRDMEENKTKAFIETITSGKYVNSAQLGANSALSAILGRMACYAGREVTWDEMMGSNQSYQGEIDLARL